jgi:hypothetical protein
MYDNIPFKTVNGSNNCKRKFRSGKPWWNDNLSTLWTDMSTAEREWLSCNKSGKAELKARFVKLRKQFDTEVQKAKRRHWYSIQEELLYDCNVDQSNFWKSFSKIGIGFSRKQLIPHEIVLDDGTTSTDINDILAKWKYDFSSLFNNPNSNKDFTHMFVHEDNDSLAFNEHISVLEVKKAVDASKRGKACGFDGIPSEAIKNDTAVLFLHVLFNICFSNGTVPSSWGKCVINPIPKTGTQDSRNPLSYRGISLASSVYKLYCYILNSRLSKWAESNNSIVDEQNGFRQKRSTVDHLSSITNIIESRKLLKRSTFCAFIDFKKAYDYVNRNLLWKKLFDAGIKGKMFSAVKSIYSSVSSCVRVNSFYTDWFDVKSGVRQGCILSPFLFNLFINDLAIYLKSLDLGIQCGNDKICMLLYADDIVLMAENEQDLQCLLNALKEWCNSNDMHINFNKSQVVHFRPPSISKTAVEFRIDEEILKVVDRYTYLGLVLHEHLNFELTAKAVAQRASRALGLVIAKCKLIGGVPYNVFTHLYDSIVWPVINYGASIWGQKSYSCINAVHYRAMRFFLGVGRYTPNSAVAGDMGWTSPNVKQWKSVCLHWSRLSIMDNDRVNKKIALWANAVSGRSCKNWFYNVKSMLNSNDLNQYIDIATRIPKHSLVKSIESVLHTKYCIDWLQSIQSVTGPSGRGNNKLRTYCQFKKEFGTEVYCKIIMPPRHRAAFSKFRCGVAPLKIETGRYVGLAVNQRKCPFCDNVESESHVLLECHLYSDLREILFNRASVYENNFLNMSKEDKLVFLFTNPNMIRVCAKTCLNLLQRRTLYLSK